jgi:tetratricopeptide (TPR) repeat protein
MFAGRYAQAAKAARQTVELVEPVAEQMAMAEPYALQDAWVALRFGRWDDALGVKVPAAGRSVQTALAHYVRGAAFAEQGKVADAEQARTALAAAIARVGEDVMISAGNSGRAILAVASADLDGRIARARKDTAGAVAAYTRAVDAEDRLSYNEPPDWLLPERERLGALLLAAGRAANAESVFRKDLEHNVGNPRSLFGLWKALEAQKKADAAAARTAFEAAWKGADVTLGPDLVGAGR